jgi:hypothetical protein
MHGILAGCVLIGKPDSYNLPQHHLRMPKNGPFDQDEPPDDLNQVAKNVWRLIKKSGAKSVNGWVQRYPSLNQSTINRLITGGIPDPSVSAIKKIADAVGLTPWQLMHPDMPSGLAVGLSEEVLRIARQLDSLTGDRRERALEIADFAAFSVLPKPAGTPAAQEAEAELQPTPKPHRVL